jgi:hypothetical protein
MPDLLFGFYYNVRFCNIVSILIIFGFERKSFTFYERTMLNILNEKNGEYHKGSVIRLDLFLSLDSMNNTRFIKGFLG